jgi:hypothetical protein
MQNGGGKVLGRVRWGVAFMGINPARLDLIAGENEVN